MKRLPIHKISRVGVGTYRMTSDIENHYESILYAIEKGYNLIDTATNYQRGNSEKLIGDILRKNNDLGNKVFIISKTGYIPSTKNITNELNTFLKKNCIDKAIIDNDFEYSIDPIYLDYQIENSLKKLNRSYIDCYLLHNPERLLMDKNGRDKENLYEQIKDAFELFESKVKEGKIRYYGISSNKFFYPEDLDSIDFLKTIKIAKSISKRNNYKFIQFPYNFMETDATKKSYYGKNLLEVARENDIKTISNRPLNMNSNGIEFRFVSYDKNLWNVEEEKVSLFFKRFFDLVNNQILKLTGGENTVFDFEPMKLLKLNYMKFSSDRAASLFFEEQAIPFLQTIYQDDFDGIVDFVSEAQKIVEKYALKNRSLKAEDYLHKLVEKQKVIKKNNLPLTACSHYLNKVNIDYVLMGLRKKNYVEDLNGEFISI